MASVGVCARNADNEHKLQQRNVKVVLLWCAMVNDATRRLHFPTHIRMTETDSSSLFLNPWTVVLCRVDATWSGSNIT